MDSGRRVGGGRRVGELSWFAEGCDSVTGRSEMKSRSYGRESLTSSDSFRIPRIGSLPLRFVYISYLYNASQYSPPSSPAMYKASPVHPNSLVDPATHSPALLELINIKVSKHVIGTFLLPPYPPSNTHIFPEYLVDCVVETVDYAMGRPTPSSSRSRSRARRPEHAKFTTFVKNVIERAEITIQTILVALVYIDRAKPHLHIALEEWALERVFLGAIIVASKVSTSAPHSPLFVSERSFFPILVPQRLHS